MVRLLVGCTIWVCTGGCAVRDAQGQSSPGNDYFRYVHDIRTYGIWYNRGRFDSVLAIPKILDTITTPATGVPQIFSFGTGANSLYYYDGFRSFNIRGPDTSTGPFVQLNPGVQQAGFLNLSQSSTFGRNLTIGSTLSGAMPLPALLNMGKSYGNNAPGSYGNAKLMLYDGTTGYFGLGVSGSNFEFNSLASSNYTWYCNALQTMQLSNVGALTLTNSLTLPNNTQVNFRNVQNTANVFGIALATNNFLLLGSLNNHIDSADNMLINGTIGSNKTITGLQVIGTQPGNGTNAAVLARSSNFADVAWNNTGGATDQKTWDINYNTTGTQLNWRAVNDANTANTVFMSITRGTGILISSIAFPTTAPLGIGTASPQANLHVVGNTRLDLGSDATGDVFYRGASNNITRLGIGTPGQVLTVNPSGTLPIWANGTASNAKIDTVIGLSATFSTTSIGPVNLGNLNFTAPAGKVGVYAFDIYLNSNSSGAVGGIFVGAGGTFTGQINTWTQGTSSGIGTFTSQQTTAANSTAGIFNNYTGNGWEHIWGTVVFIGTGETFQVIAASSAGTTTVQVLPAGTFMRMRQL